jgi:hypothetical protein
MGDHSWNIWLHAVGIYGTPKEMNGPLRENLIHTYINHNKYEYTKWSSNYEIMMKNKELTNLSFPYSISSGTIE